MGRITFFFIKCAKCDEMVIANTKCKQCGCVLNINSKKNNFFVYFPFELKVRKIINNHFDAVIDYMNRKHSKDVLSDIDDGLLYEQISRKNPPNLITLALTLNADGANIFRSSKSSLWPLQIVLNCLPPSLRYLPDNIVVSTLYYGSSKPNMFDLLYLLAAEIHSLNERFISFYKNNEFYNFIPKLLLCACDLPARSAIQNFMGVNAKYGCPYCYHPGYSIPNHSKGTTIRYVRDDATTKVRRHSNSIELADQMEKSRKNNIKDQKDNILGIKGYSALLLFDDIDIIESVPIDFMHSVALGITKDLIEIWIGKKRIPKPPYDDFKIKTVRLRDVFAKRISQFKPTRNVNRKPRSIFEISNFKASELLNLLWYYLRYALIGILPTRLVKHFEKLSAGTFVLCKNNIELDEAKRACELLKEFANEFEEIYGRGAVTLNLHLLNHYYNVVINCGPLWCYSLFAFENNIGVLKKIITGKTDVLMQLAKKYPKLHRNGNIVQSKSDECGFEAFQPKVLHIERKLIQATENAEDLSEGNIKIWKCVKIGRKIYTSMHYINTNSVDYFVMLKNGDFGKIVFFIGEKFSPKILLQKFKTKHQNYHLYEVEPTETYCISTCTDIQKKMMYLQTASFEYITDEPKTYGLVNL